MQYLPLILHYLSGGGGNGGNGSGTIEELLNHYLEGQVNK